MFNFFNRAHMKMNRIKIRNLAISHYRMHKVSYDVHIFFLIIII